MRVRRTLRVKKYLLCGNMIQRYVVSIPTFHNEVRKEVKIPDFRKPIIIIYLLRSKLQKKKQGRTKVYME